MIEDDSLSYVYNISENSTCPYNDLNSYNTQNDTHIFNELGCNGDLFLRIYDENGDIWGESQVMENDYIC